ncbi:MAG TPA: copper resistance protein B [Cellvibrionaceae bacterium]
MQTKLVTSAVISILLVLTLAHSPLSAAAEHMHDHGDNPLLGYILVDHLEAYKDDENTVYALDAQGWVGKDLEKFWLKTDVSYSDGKTQEAEIQALYSRALLPFWDMQMGVRHDARPAPSRDWLVLGVQGLAPYWFDINTALFIGQSADVAARVQMEYELLLTQQLILTPDVTADFYGQNDAETGTGAGLSEVNAGMRLRYEIKREFAPFLGVNWTRAFGNTADFLQSHEEAVSDTQWVIGIHAWF